jgi:hypothetical protein
MKKVALSSLVLLVMTAPAFTFRIGRTPVTSTTQAALITNAAYRDGLFVGRLTAEDGGPHRVSTGRWANREDQSNYAKGYEQAYQESLPSARAN